MDENPEDVGQSTEDILSQKQNTEGGDTGQNPEKSSGREPGDLTDDNIKSQRDPLDRARTANRKSVSSLEEGVGADESGEERAWKVAQQESQINHINQEDFDEKTKEEIKKAERVKEEVEKSGNYWRIDDETALDFNADIEERDQEWIDDFSTKTAGTDPVSMADSLDHIERTAMRWGAGAEDQGLYKGIFDAHFQETGDRNKSAAQSADAMSDFRSTWESHHRDEFEHLSEDLTQFFDEVHLTSRDSEEASGDISLVENLSRRVSQYQDIRDEAEESIREYEEADSEKNPDITERGAQLIRDLKDEAASHLEGQDNRDPGKSEFEHTEQEREVKKTWTATKIAALESVEETYESAREQKENYEDLKEDVSERKETYTDLMEDLELTNLEGVDEGTEETLEEIDTDINTVLDLASLSDGEDITSQLDDGPRAENHQIGPANVSDEDAADRIVEEAKEQVYGEEDEDGLVHEYDQKSLDDKLIQVMDEDVTESELQLLQLQGMYAKATETAQVLGDYEERLESEIQAYEETLEDIEDSISDEYDSLDDFTDEEREEAIEQLNEYLPEEEEVTA
ncbi:hypothetical protein [Candidatus Nanohalobium constans]|uniref:Uncharacterized protein n=1 Tax=Candidatus Nanohalobium constans TaxID=2565781 RepID=A0A5Q0UGM7_9ARCH|nr:hypothetical protein [Candidatus Nanohalobium constans]QGA80803.1 hypothetical protein LC1Nh_0921 [Candidatus Nanohalobium constans]